MIYEHMDVVRVPFPFTDKTASKNRPALIISRGGAFNAPANHSVMAMITSATHTPWPLDCHITNLNAAALPAPSLVRFKLFTLDHRLIRGKLGTLAAEDREKVRQALITLLGLD